MDKINTDKVIENYKNDERMMIQIFVQWCINNELDPHLIYEKAYPGQEKNRLLIDAISQAIKKEESEEVSDEMILELLSIYGNDDLAFIVSEESENKKKS
ncbi:hypothetical protein [Evansella cellulosilytica]|uniref:Uncharacterized protein n=1 Tax=Evansella cellulosilytica (strain ATCC 21833 / DSM 2522 / FERM P-1141 / JCM 9156 / N-4) TaxID=649639 RepID=E6U107_EVAC2|nr:hypothetical protein [Evansella cellulosilytica]ADU30319.1 hypothetical protein Bcell_2057 [Evansella cellulosilytica DSM 2522]